MNPRQVVNERRVAIHLALIHAELLDNNLLYLLLYAAMIPPGTINERVDFSDLRSDSASTAGVRCALNPNWFEKPFCHESQSRAGARSAGARAGAPAPPAAPGAGRWPKSTTGAAFEPSSKVHNSNSISYLRVEAQMHFKAPE